MSFMFDEPILYKDRTGSALSAALSAFEFAGRGLGQANRMLCMLKPGDRLVCANAEESHHYRRELAKRGLDGVTVVFGSPTVGEPLGPDNMHMVAKQPTYFTHLWYLAYWRRELELLEGRLEQVEKMVQGPRHEPEHVRRLTSSEG